MCISELLRLPIAVSVLPDCLFKLAATACCTFAGPVTNYQHGQAQGRIAGRAGQPMDAQHTSEGLSRCRCTQGSPSRP